MFEGAELKQLKGRVMVPTGFFKAIYDATAKRASVYIVGHRAEDQTFNAVSVDEATSRIGIDVFPQLPAEVKVMKTGVLTPASRTDCER